MGLSDLNPLRLLDDVNPFRGALPLMDGGWLMVESPQHPSNVGALFLFDPPPGTTAAEWIETTYTDAIANDDLRTPFDLRLVQPNGVLGTFRWTTEHDVDMPWHVRRLALPSPGRPRELLSMVSTLHPPMLDRTRPMWEVNFIEGMEDGRIALYWRASHALLDGIAAMRQVFHTLTPDPERRGMVAPWNTDPEKAQLSSKLRDARRERRVDLTPEGVVRTATAVAASNFRLTSTLSQQVLRGVSGRSRVQYPAPDTRFNRRLTSSRRFVAQSYDLDRFRGAARAGGTTINDVVLTVCGGALRRYLLDLDELPDRSLTALVPVSVRPEDGSEADGNALSATLVTLATDDPDPVTRLATVNAAMQRNKARMATMTRSELGTYGTALFGPILVGQATGTAGGIPPICNVVISNVPGPTVDQYWNGARLDAFYPMSLLFDGYGLNITQASYAGRFHFGIMADRKAIPAVQRMIDHIEEELSLLEASQAVPRAETT